MSLRTFIFGVLFLLWTGAVSQADVLFTHEEKSNEFMLGETSARTLVGYTGDVKYADKKTRYESGLLKRFFGKVKTGRNTSEFDLKANTVSEVDWANRYVYVYPIANISDPEWHRKRSPMIKERRELVEQRYEVSPPQISFEFSKEPETVNGYSTKRVDIKLNLETTDKKKNAKSLTRITQSLWLSTEVKGYDLYTNFNKALSRKTGVNGYRLGLLGDLLSYYPQDLASIEDDLARVDGYTVKAKFLLEGSYIQTFEDKPPKKTDKVFKDETSVLTRVQEIPSLDSSLFLAPESFARKKIK
ncbi:hypothetical protein DO021_13465 [Desulfobacter hydrogenophilus]|uniref:Uncharacterized protein n=1 Tax=Desulfobacter hydrogenophilus TaxID=2291 RepID=A0A328FCP4_9BACT|nr:hypothetical protein DO021_13465 [Desulfobacter hydrogenophilus]